MISGITATYLKRGESADVQGRSQGVRTGRSVGGLATTVINDK